LGTKQSEKWQNLLIEKLKGKSTSTVRNIRLK